MVSTTLGEQQEKRVARAIAESPDWTWTKTPFGWIVTTGRGTYQVDERSCSCPDYKHACCGVELSCKHQVGLRMKLAEETLRAAPPVVADKEAREAIIAAESELWERIFGRG